MEKETPVKTALVEKKNSSSPAIPLLLIDQIIGQPAAVQAIRQAAHQHRNILLIGQPGTGKSMLAKALVDLLPQKSPPDLLVYADPENNSQPRIITIPAGQGKGVIDHHKQQALDQTQRHRLFVNGITFGILVGAGLLSFLPGPFEPSILFFGIITAISWLLLQNFVKRPVKIPVPRILVDNSETTEVPFVDASGATAGALLGDVRHDPFQSGGLETPPHELVVPGLIHKGNGGVLLIDEIGTLDLDTQFKLLTILQEKQFPIEGQSEASSGSTIRTTLAPCDFILVAAGNLETIRMLHPALRSRFQGFGKEILMNEVIADTPTASKLFNQFVQQEVEKDGKIPQFTPEAVTEIIMEARLRSPVKNHLSLRLRDLGGIVRSAGDIAILKEKNEVTEEDVVQARKIALPLETQVARQQVARSIAHGTYRSSQSKVGQTVTLGLFGDQGVVCPIVVDARKASDNKWEFEASVTIPRKLFK